eukprot:5514182-Amphidinium_carterae.1
MSKILNAMPTESKQCKIQAVITTVEEVISSEVYKFGSQTAKANVDAALKLLKQLSLSQCPVQAANPGEFMSQ